MASSGVLEFETGMDEVEYDLIWRIKHFPIVVQDEALINLQEIDFTVGDIMNHYSTWAVFLRCDSKRSINIMYKQKNLLSGSWANQHVYSNMHFDIKDKNGRTSWKKATKPRALSDTADGWGFRDVIEINDGEDKLGDTLVIYMKFRLYFSNVRN